MKNKKEKGKNILLVVLVLLLIGQIQGTWTYTDSGQSGGLLSAVSRLFGKTANSLGADMDCAAYPVELAVCSENGFYAKRSGEMQVDFNSISPILQSALQQAGDFQEVADFGEDLNETLVYIRYDGEIPLTLLCDWLGCEGQDWDYTLGGLAVIRRQDGSCLLYLRDSRTHLLYRAEASVDSQLFTQYTNLFSIGGGGFAYQLQYDRLLPETLIIDGIEKFSILKAGIPVFGDSQNSRQALLEAFSYNPYTVKSYEENDGSTTVFVGNQSTLTMEEDGHVLFEASSLGGGIEAGSQGETEMAEYGEYATDMVQNVLKSYGGGQAFLCGVLQEDGVISFLFRQMHDGVPVDDTVHGYFAKLTFQNGKLTQGDFYLRQYTETGEVLGLLPGKQLAQLVTGRGEVSIRYVDSGSERILPQWKQMD